MQPAITSHLSVKLLLTVWPYFCHCLLIERASYDKIDSSNAINKHLLHSRARETPLRFTWLYLYLKLCL